MNSLAKSKTGNMQPATLIDTHCHLEMKDFDNDREDIIQRAKEAGLEALITVASDIESCIKVMDLSSKYDFIYAAVGMHPHDAKDFNEEIYEQLKALTSPPHPPLSKGGTKRAKVVAIGETGLDYHYDNSPRKIQKDVFLEHLRLANETGLPAIIHSREAKNDTLELLKEADISRGVLHCFSGDMDMAEKVMSMGLYISIAGPVTFRKSLKLQEIARSIPDDYLLIETDAPYLSPEPFRGKRNEPSFIRHTTEYIAGLRGISYEDLARITTLNARRLFRIGPIADMPEIAYKIRDSLYLNITNRCTNKCTFCVKFHSDYVKGHKLRLDHEPTEGEIIKQIGNPSDYKEIVFCGYGEPLTRIDIVKSVSKWIKENNGKVRINTNGHANLIHKRDILPELKGLVDSISVSLDAHNEETYNKICKPVFRNAFQGVLQFISKAREIIPDVSVTVVELEGVDVQKCREIADSLGVKFRLRKFNVVG